MWNMIWPILIVIGANTIYNVSAKSTPTDVNSFASLTLSYVIGAVVSVILFFVTSENKNLFTELSKTNWASLVLGIAIIGLEFGYICIYRAGWKISVASLVANISLALVLLIVGMLLYKETISLRQIIGIAISVIGLIVIAK